MGTNYYARTKICDCCGRYESHHIGKSSAGWQFSFHAATITDELKLTTMQAWKTWLTETNSKIFTEYGDEVSHTEFLEMVESKRNEPRNHARLYPDRAWVDTEGYSFGDYDFS